MSEKGRDDGKKVNHRDKKDEFGFDDYSQSFFEKRVGFSRRLAEESKRSQKEDSKAKKTPLSSTTLSSKQNIPKPQQRAMTDEEFARMVSLSNFSTGAGSSSASSMREWDSLPRLSLPRATNPGRNNSRGQSSRGGNSTGTQPRRDTLRRKESRKDSSRDGGSDRGGSSRRSGAGGSAGSSSSTGSTSNQ